MKMHKSRRIFISISSAYSQKNEIERSSLITLKKCIHALPLSVYCDITCYKAMSTATETGHQVDGLMPKSLPHFSHLHPCCSIFQLIVSLSRQCSITKRDLLLAVSVNHITTKCFAIIKR